jgi:DNA-binding MarR family transcriptional regulator
MRVIGTMMLTETQAEINCSSCKSQNLTAYLIISIPDDMNEVESAASRLRMTFRLLKRRAEALSDPGSPNRSEQGVLAWLEDKGATTPRALADAHQVRPQTMQQTLDSLSRRRWIKRADHPTDRRRILISLSASGRRVLLKGRRRRQQWLEQEIGRLSVRDLHSLTGALDIFERILNPETPKTNHL